MEIYIFIILVIVHIACSFAIFIIFPGRWRKRKEYSIPIFLVPIFGPLMALTIELISQLNQAGAKPVELESLKHDEDIYWQPFKGTQEEKDIIPLEEAILISDIRTRRRAMLHTFREDAFNYLDILMVARQNEDVDTTHYATIQISKIQRTFQLEIQKYAKACEHDPENVDLLDEYIELLEKFLASPLPEKSILVHQRQVYSDLLDRMLKLAPNDRLTMIRKLRNYVDNHEDPEATFAVVNTLKTKWPEDEQVWIESLRACVDWHDHEKLQQIIDEMQRANIVWTKRGREQVYPWVQVS